MWLLAVVFLLSSSSAVLEAKYDIFKFLDHIDSRALVRQLASDMQNDSVCRNHTYYYLENIMNLTDWAIKMLDSSTKIPDSILMGHFTHLGNFDECLSVEVHGSGNDFFHTQHCLVHYSLPAKIENIDTVLTNKIAAEQKLNVLNNMNMKQLHFKEWTELSAIGIDIYLKMSYCLPSSCNPEIIRYHLNRTVNSLFHSTVPAVTCSHGSRGRSLQTADWITIALLIFFGSLCIMSTSYDLLTAFSWYTNGKKLLATSESDSDTLQALHGIRFITISWIVMAHNYALCFAIPVINYIALKDIVPNFWRLYLTNAPVSVDTFFFLGGLLVSYVFLKKMNKNKNASFNIPLYYLHRYIRLTPSYAILILVQATLMRYTGSGPLWHVYIEEMIEPCQTDWWKNILYVNNYFENADEGCMAQGWYLAIDMQLFLLSPIILYPLWKWSSKLSLSFLGILILCGLSTAFSVSYIKKLPVSRIGASQELQNLQYLPTHTRFTPWLIGVLFGYIIYITKRRTVCIPKRHAVLGWVVGATALLGSLLGIYPFYQTSSEPTQLEESLYTTLHRSVWAVGVGWVSFACVFGIGGPINTFLSWKIFQPLSRLTYCVYLVHEMYQSVRVFSTKIPGYMGDGTLIPSFISDLVISLLLAVIISLCFESPIIVLEKHLLRSGHNNGINTTKDEILNPIDKALIPNTQSTISLEAVTTSNDGK